MAQSQRLALCPGSGENSARFNRESGMRLYSQRQNISVGTRTTMATKGFKKIDSSNIMGRCA